MLTLSVPFFPLLLDLFHLTRSLPHLLAPLFIDLRKDQCKPELLRLSPNRHLKHLVLQVIDEKVEGVREGLEEVGVQGETLLLQELIGGGIVDVVEEVEGCAEVSMGQNVAIGLLD